MKKLVLVRHGQSTWNADNRFTGWVDVDLTERGNDEANESGRLLKAEGYEFDVVLCSVLKRAVRTMWNILGELDQMWLPVRKDWQLNERHYGGLQGLNKKETTEKHGVEQVLKWRRGYAIRPPELDANDPMQAANDRRYQGIKNLPVAESLYDTGLRVIPYWEEQIVPLLKANQRVLIVAHGNSLRSLIKHLSHISDDDIVELNVPTGVPLVYELDDDLNEIQHYYLGDQSKIAAAVNEVANQAST
ncbi:MAG: 2,3-bisphosphoglycerate-dependent phosphoglycerate mutase [Parasphingorhabdus sp.]|jgi:2,3-bisphosphoglycerate-dependent phosphoglycerate mutase